MSRHPTHKFAIDLKSIPKWGLGRKKKQALRMSEYSMGNLGLRVCLWWEEWGLCMEAGQEGSLCPIST